MPGERLLVTLGINSAGNLIPSCQRKFPFVLSLPFVVPINSLPESKINPAVAVTSSNVRAVDFQVDFSE